jgi:phosphoribosyl 1,2-cyclic phosphodiesterase
VRLSLLGSGSSGNAAYVEAGDTRLLVDAGLPRADIEARLARLPDLAPPGASALDRLDAVLVTHDHSDHAGCAASLGRPVYATEGTRRVLGWSDTVRVLAGVTFRIGALDVHPVLVPHDAEESVGYVLGDGRTRVGILTDCGWDDPQVAAAYAGCDLVVLETNHDATMLRYGPYPPSLKRRVGGRRGHLSNDQAASLLSQMCKLGRPPRVVIAAHLSQANNRGQLAQSALSRVLGRGGRVVVATQSRGTPLFHVDADGVRIEPMRNEQLTFAFPLAQVTAR